jgi:hypothetical protein
MGTMEIWARKGTRRRGKSLVAAGRYEIATGVVWACAAMIADIKWCVYIKRATERQRQQGA